MSDYSIYSTGWYSVSPGFTWWYNNPVRLAELKARSEAKRNAAESERKEKARYEKIEEGTISVYA
tara:strand:- start:2468 stop:2662 length:195 start_codon:yes stop_codon:yes gene_type:complete